MHALGSPLHAFDFDKLAGGRIGVRRATKGEKLRTLDGQERALEPDDLLITDGERPIAIAGIMGGEETEVSESTTSVLLEAANFEAVGVMRSSERLRLRSEASNRWEKGIDPEAALQASRFATELLVSLTGARWTGHADVRAEPQPVPTIAYRPARASEVAGLEIEEAEQRRRLERLGFAVGDDWTVRVPTWRAGDVTREIDLVEEVARFDLERVPATQPVRSELNGRLTDAQRIRRRIQDTLVGFGIAEAYTWSLLPDDPVPGAIRLPEPLSTEQAVLRTSLTDGLIAAAERNVDAGNADIALFELGTSTCRAAKSCRTSAGTSRASSRAASRGPRASSRRCTPRCVSARRSSGPRTCASRVRERAPPKAGCSSSRTAGFPARGASSSSTSTR